MDSVLLIERRNRRPEMTFQVKPAQHERMKYLLPSSLTPSGHPLWTTIVGEEVETRYVYSTEP